MTDTDLLIVGGGPVGLSAALLASRNGLSSVLVEPRSTPSAHPKARGVRNRAMELFWLWGIEPALRAGAPPDPDHGFIYCNTLAGDEYARTPAGQGNRQVSPTGDCRVPQDHLERVLRERVRELPLLDIRYGTELRGLQQDDDHVEAAIRNRTDNTSTTVRARYVIAADGVASRVRDLLGITMSGTELGFWQSVYWHGDISELTADRTAIQYLTATPEGGFVTVATVDGRERWVTFRMQGSEHGKPDELCGDDAVSLVRAALGTERFPTDVVSTATYLVTAQVAERYRAGRVFLAGDAAHAFPPTGGMGLNTGVQDVQNLIWKLVLVDRGVAGDALLDTYEAERRPVAVDSAEWSHANARRFEAVWRKIAEGDGPGAPADRQRAHIAATARDLGFRYQSGAVLHDGSAPPLIPQEYESIASVGARVTHLWVKSDGVEHSTLQLCDGRFTLLAGAAGQRWLDAVERLPAARELGLAGHAAGTRSFDIDPDAVTTNLGIAPAGAMLVRPDGHVAWRTEGDEDPVGRLRHVLTQLLRTGDV